MEDLLGFHVSAGFQDKMLSKGQPITFFFAPSSLLSLVIHARNHALSYWGEINSLHLLQEHIGLSKEEGGQGEKAGRDVEKGVSAGSLCLFSGTWLE